MITIPASIDDGLSSSIAKLIMHNLPEAQCVDISGVVPMFGGNARKAWGFDLAYSLDGGEVKVPCVMLSQNANRQIDTDVAQEFRVLHGMNGKGARVPAAIAMDADGAIVGAPSIVLQRLSGQADAVKFLNFPGDIGIPMTYDLNEVVAQLHSVEWNQADFDPALKGLMPKEVALIQVEHWYQTFLKQRLEPLPMMSSLFAWLKEHLPEPERICLVHGDLRPGNFLYEGASVTGLLDWEMAHLGDPLEDLGWIYRPLWSPMRFVSLREFVRRYGESVGREISWANMLYYQIYSELKFATISLTAARSFSNSKVPNLRHADRAATVAPCLKRCLDLVALHREESGNV